MIYKLHAWETKECHWSWTPPTKWLVSCRVPLNESYILQIHNTPQEALFITPDHEILSVLNEPRVRRLNQDVGTLQKALVEKKRWNFSLISPNGVFRDDEPHTHGSVPTYRLTHVLSTFGKLPDGNSEKVELFVSDSSRAATWTSPKLCTWILLSSPFDFTTQWHTSISRALRMKSLTRLQAWSSGRIFFFGPVKTLNITDTFSIIIGFFQWTIIIEPREWEFADVTWVVDHV